MRQRKSAISYNLPNVGSFIVHMKKVLHMHGCLLSLLRCMVLASVKVHAEMPSVCGMAAPYRMLVQHVLVIFHF